MSANVSTNMSTQAPLDWSKRPISGAKPRVIVIGAGMSGLATGVYAQMNGFDSRIFESHLLPGGCCTAWSRRGYIFDYCIGSRLIGSGGDNEANQLWRELGALDGKSIAYFEMFNCVIGEDGRSVKFYNDPDRLERHLLELSPADAPVIREFCNDLRRFIHVEKHYGLKPKPLQSRWERLVSWLKILPAFRLFWRTGTVNMGDFAQRFQDPLLRLAFPAIIYVDQETLPLFPFLYNMSCAYRNDAGFPQGGSLALARSIEERYLSLGGDIRYRGRVAKILVEDDRAVGIELSDGERHYADYVVSACDGRTTIYHMLEGKYTTPEIDKLYDELLDQPLSIYHGVVSVFLGVRIPTDLEGPHSTTYVLSEEEASQLPGALQRYLWVQQRSRCCPSFAPPGRSVWNCVYYSSDDWHELRKEDRRAYRVRKKQVVDFVLDYLERKFPGIRDKVEVVSVATPATTARFTGNYKGSIAAWKGFCEASDITERLAEDGRMQLPGLSGFYMAGHWAGMSGLVLSASSGRFVVQYLCQDRGRAFNAWPSANDRPWDPRQFNIKVRRTAPVELRTSAGEDRERVAEDAMACVGGAAE
jgi:phytoene dehydrogenase-like protein